MCSSGQPPGLPLTAKEAVTMTQAGLAHLASCDAAELPTVTQAECLRALERMESLLTAARAAMLSAFTARGGFTEDGQASARTWLTWQTGVTGGAAAGALGWMRRLAQHRSVAAALARGLISASWARMVCDWTDLLPADDRDAADDILLAAAVGGASLADLAGLAEQIRRRCAPPDSDRGGFADRGLHLGVTIGGAARLDGDLTPDCAAALEAVLQSLGKKAGAPDVRTKAQRNHDALQEACRRLIGAGCLPDRAGQPTHIQLHMTLDQLRGMPESAETEEAWAAARATGTGWLDGPAAAAAACDATIIPVVVGRIDRHALGTLTDRYLDAIGFAGQADRTVPAMAGPAMPESVIPESGSAGSVMPGSVMPGSVMPGSVMPGSVMPGSVMPGSGSAGSGSAGSVMAGSSSGTTASTSAPAATEDSPDLAPGQLPESMPAGALPAATRERISTTLLRLAADALSGPSGLAAALRSGIPGLDFPSVSLPLEVGAATETIPAQLRRAVILRDEACAFPGCDQPPAACDVHHIIPRGEGGPTRLTNLLLLCAFHHKIAVHRWGWSVALNADGSVTATSPDGTRVAQGNGPPGREQLITTT